MELNNLIRAAIFCAVAVGMGFSLMFIPNIELITVMVFLSGIYLGIGWGALVGFTAMAIYSGLNPMGSGLSFPPLFLMQIIGMAFAGIIGGLVRPLFNEKKINFLLMASLAFLGFTITLIYDLLTLLSYPLSAGLGLSGILAALFKGLGFTLLHEISNAVVFTVTVPPVMRYIKYKN